MKKGMYLLVMVLCIQSDIFAEFSIQNENNEHQLDSAKYFYDEGEYQKGLQLLKQVETDLGSNSLSFELQYNLGNFYFRSGDVAKAVLSYERALLLDPGNEDALYNLALVNEKLKDEFDVVPEVSLQVLFLKLNNVISSHVLYLLGVLILLVLSAYTFWKKRTHSFKAFSKSWYAVGASLFFMLWSAGQYYAVLQKEPEAVIMRNRVSVQSEPGDSSSNTSAVLVKINAGSKVKVLAQEEGWLRIKTPSNTIGWVSNESASLIDL